MKNVQNTSFISWVVNSTYIVHWVRGPPLRVTGTALLFLPWKPQSIGHISLDQNSSSYVQDRVKLAVTNLDGQHICFL
jgi:hypothetical protein